MTDLVKRALGEEEAIAKRMLEACKKAAYSTGSIHAAGCGRIDEQLAWQEFWQMKPAPRKERPWWKQYDRTSKR